MHAPGAAAVEYRRVTLDDAAALAELFSNPDVYDGTLQLPMPGPDLWRQRLQGSVASVDEFSIVAVAQGRVIASAGLHRSGTSLRVRHSMVLGIVVDRAFWGQGVGAELMRRLLDWADGWAGVLRIELGVYADNARAIGLYEKFGFAREGIKRAHALRDGRYADTLMMARLHPRPPQLPATPGVAR
jgi:L-phenylalanine/L-methionine N-acetyltransferase